MFSLWLMGLAQAGEVSGQTWNGAGEPMSDVAVFVIDERLAYASTLTSELGEYAIGGLPAGRYRVWAGPGDTINAVSRAWPDAWDFCQGTLLEIDEDVGLEALDFQLVTGGRLNGVVRDATGGPVVGASVLAAGVSSRVSGLSRGATTDLEGRFAIVGLDGEDDVAESWTVRVSAAGWPDQYLGPAYEEEEGVIVEVVRGSETNEEPMALLDGIVVEGVVRGPEGPLQDAEVFAYSSGQIQDVRTDENGAYEVMGLPPGEVLVWANLEGFALTYLGGEPAPSGGRAVPDEGELASGVDLDLPYESRLVGQLLGEEGEDLSSVTLLAYHESMRAGLGDEMEADGSFAVGRLHGAGYHLYVYAGDEGYVNDFVRDESGAPTLFSLETGADSDPVEVELSRGASISGRVYREGDQDHGVYGASVTAIPGNSDHRALGAGVERDGSFEIRGILPGSYTLQVSFSPVCLGDGGYVSQWWDGALVEGDSDSLVLDEGEHIELVFELPVDDDLDGMSDDWERENGLDPSADDSLEDPDRDGISNLDEYLGGTDPMESTTGCGCSEAPDKVGLWWAWIAGLLVCTRRLR